MGTDDDRLFSGAWGKKQWQVGRIPVLNVARDGLPSDIGVYHLFSLSYYIRN
jgi:hypothetical protein